ncbi:helix-turn-helix transcriptional regulator [Micromonospora sp. DH14]|uniref:helix-turn-helix domain-containing protein n=2 Tax=unclassified Micromonospora TaxID=2617518 RepID=UPI002441E7E4|nr:helix-turn-helix transcriptional regulator [Micromonospora sp. DH14]MDG9674850.1 helix-turn-helix transcriptional regulator [Micromonospora sp. DH14]
MARSHGENAPNTYVQNGHWPEATLRPDAPGSAHYAQEFARRLAAEMRGRPISNRELARLAGLSHPTIGSALNGDRYVDLRTLANLEVALGVELYPVRMYERLEMK